MRIIKEGKTPEKETIKTCGSCKTKFAYTPEDMKNDRDGRFVICPHCAKFIAVPPFTS